MNPAFISAFAALAGAIIGGLTSFATSWLTQRAQLRSADRQARRPRLEALYKEYISLAAGPLCRRPDPPDGRSLACGAALRVGQPYAPSVGSGGVDAATRIDDNILETYMGQIAPFKKCGIWPARAE
jgi:hypothetical protein